jgi:hypothetical protein
LKRFQFDNTSRRKLTNRVDFPLDDFDLSDYLASISTALTDKTNDANGDTTANDLPSASDISASYDLYCAVHHIGALSGGHYITAVRVNKGNTASASSSEGKASDKETSWWLYNDDVTSEIKELNEICSPSAYLLFYIRKDVQQMNAHDLFAPFRAKAPPRSRTVSGSADGAELTRNYSISSNQGKMFPGSRMSWKFMPRAKSHSISSNHSTMSTSTAHTTVSAPASSSDYAQHPGGGNSKSKSLSRTSIVKASRRASKTATSEANPNSHEANSGCLPS